MENNNEEENTLIMNQFCSKKLLKIFFCIFIFLMLNIFINPLSVNAAVINSPELLRTLCVKGNSSSKFYVYSYVNGNPEAVYFPIWTSANGQDDLNPNWKSENIGESGLWQLEGELYNWRYIVDITQHNNELGPYAIDAYYKKGETWQAIGGLKDVIFYSSATQANAKRFVNYSSANATDMVVTRTTNNSYFDVYVNITGDVQKVKIPTWSSANGQDDLGDWPIGESGNWTIDGKKYNYHRRILLSEHNNEFGLYNIHIYAYDIDGNSECVITDAVNFSDASTQDSTIKFSTAPNIVRTLAVRGLSQAEFFMYCYVEGDVQRVQFPTWTVSNTQDDILDEWSTSKDVRGLQGDWEIYNDGTTQKYNYRFKIRLSEHGYEYGEYAVHIYAYDDHGNKSSIGKELNFVKDPNVDAEGILEVTTYPETIKRKIVRNGDTLTIYRRMTDLRGIDIHRPLIDIMDGEGNYTDNYNFKQTLETGEYVIDGEKYNVKCDFSISQLGLKSIELFQPSITTWNIAGNSETGGFHSRFTNDYFGGYDESKITFDRIMLLKADSNGYYIYINLTSKDSNIRNVMYPTWTAYAGETSGGNYHPQDDITTNWHKPINGTAYGESGNWTINGNQYNNRFYVDKSVHNNETGVYYTHIYAYDELSNSNKINVEVNFQDTPVEGDVTEIIDGQEVKYDLMYVWPTCLLYENGVLISKDSLNNLISQIPYGSSDHYEIVMEQSESVATMLVIPENKIVNLNIKGRTVDLQYGGNGVFDVQGTLNLYDTLGTGKIEAIQPSGVTQDMAGIKVTGKFTLGIREGIMQPNITVITENSNGKGYGILNSGGTVTLGIDELDITRGLDIQGSDYGYYSNNSKSVLNFYDGKITGLVAQSVIENGSTVKTPYEYSVARVNNQNGTETAILGIIDVMYGSLSFYNMQYDGTAKEPTPAVVLNGSTLVRGIDYTVSYENNIESGMATGIVTGIGNYIGTIKKQFLIYTLETEVEVTGLITESSVGTHNCNNYAVDKYDSNYHWKECNACSKEYVSAGRPNDNSWENTYLEIVTNASGERMLIIKNTKLAHNYTEYWTMGDSCHSNNKLVHICNCGYSYTTNNNRIHAETTLTWDDRIHVTICNVCRDHLSEKVNHTDKNGNLLTCTNSGNCNVCGRGVSYHSQTISFDTSKSQYCYESTSCAYCGETIYEEDKCDVVHNTEGKSFNGTIKFYFNNTIIPKEILTSSITLSNYKRAKINKHNITYNNNVATFTYEGEFTDYESEASDHFVGILVVRDENGVEWRQRFVWIIKPDLIKPEVNTKVESLNIVNNWSINSKVIVSGTENYCSSVTIQMKDGNEIIYSGKTNVNADKTFVFEFAPDIAADVNGKEYEIIVTDTLGNITAKKITISKVDRVSPNIQKNSQLDSENVWSTSTPWSKSKEFVITATDEGSQVAKIKLQDVKNNETGYDFEDVYGISARDESKNPILNTREYKFIGDVKGYVTAAVYLQDEAGNESIEYLRIYNLDNTAPEITVPEKVTTAITNINIKDTASGVKYFAVTNSNFVDSNGKPIVPTNYGTTNVTAGNELNYWYQVENLNNIDVTFNSLMSGTYYVWAQDLLGNMSYTELNVESVAMVTEWTIPVNKNGNGLGTTIKLPIQPDTSGSTYKYYVDWGDGTINEYSCQTGFPTHTYYNTAQNVYTIKISGEIYKFGSSKAEKPELDNEYKDFYDYTQYMTGLKAWGEINAKGYGFAYCTNLRSQIPEPTEKSFNSLYGVWGMFYECNNLIGSIPENLFKNCPKFDDFSFIFYQCNNLTGGIPENLLADHPQIKNAQEIFTGCKGLTGSIPKNLFAKNISLEQLGYAFAYCKGLTGTIPEDLLVNNKKIKDVVGLFDSCAGLTGNIPEKLFANSSKIESFAYTFNECSGLSGNIPANLFAKNTQVSSFEGTFNNCVGLTGAIPVNLFANNKKVNTLAYTFMGCSGLTGLIPEKLFEPLEDLTNVRGTFKGCSRIKGGIITINTDKTTDTTAMFSNCTSLENIVLGESFKNLNNERIFENCSVLRAIIMLNNPETLSDVGMIANIDTLGLGSATIIYVPYKEDELLYEQKNTNVSEERIERVVKAIPPNPDHVGLYQEYIDPGYTVAGYTIDEKAAWEQYGFYVEVRGNPVDTSEPGSEWIKYTLKRDSER